MLVKRCQGSLARLRGPRGEGAGGWTTASPRRTNRQTGRSSASRVAGANVSKRFRGSLRVCGGRSRRHRPPLPAAVRCVARGAGARHRGRCSELVLTAEHVAFGGFFSGKLLKAEYILSRLISDNGATGELPPAPRPPRSAGPAGQ